MYKLYNVVKHKTNIKGFWQDKGKVYIDNINISTCYADYVFVRKARKLFNSGELAIFYIKDGKAYIEDNKGNLTVLKHCIRYKKKYISKDYIKALLKQYEGLTIYREGDQYIIEIWKP